MCRRGNGQGQDVVTREMEVVPEKWGWACDWGLQEVEKERW